MAGTGALECLLFYGSAEKRGRPAFWSGGASAGGVLVRPFKHPQFRSDPVVASPGRGRFDELLRFGRAVGEDVVLGEEAAAGVEGKVFLVTGAVGRPLADEGGLCGVNVVFETICGRWPKALNRAAIRRLPAAQPCEAANGSVPMPMVRYTAFIRTIPSRTFT